MPAGERKQARILRRVGAALTGLRRDVENHQAWMRERIEGLEAEVDRLDGLVADLWKEVRR